MGRDSITPQSFYRIEKTRDFNFFVIASKGKEQEPKYFGFLKNDFKTIFESKKLQIEVLKRPKDQENDSAPEYVKKMMLNFLEQNDFDYENLESIPAKDTFCLVVDTDQWTSAQLQDLSNFCSEKEQFNLIISNPCFEFWLILHLSEFTATIKQNLENTISDKQSQVCKKIWKVDLNHNLKEALKLENLKLAVERAKILDKNPQKDYPTDFLTTKVYQIIEKMGILTSIK